MEDWNINISVDFLTAGRVYKVNQRRTGNESLNLRIRNKKLVVQFKRKIFFCFIKIMSMKNRISQLLFFVLLIVASMAQHANAQFVHPGGVHTIADLDRMKEKVTAKESPWIDGWNLMLKDPKAQSSYTANPSTSVSGADGVRQQAARDATAAYYNFLRWYITGDEQYAQCAVNIINAWSYKINGVVSGELFQLPIAVMVQAAELLRIYPGWSKDDIDRFKYVCLNYFYPACHSFVGECGSWSGWDGPANADILYIGIFCDNKDIYDEAINYYKNGSGGGAINNMVWQPSGQVAEMGRDIPHSEIGPGSAAEFCQSAFNQGDDLFSYENNRLLSAYEYMCKYNLNNAVDWVPYILDCNNNNFFYPSVLNPYRLSESPDYELIFNHYVTKEGLDAPYLKEYLKLRGVYPVGGEYSGYSGLTYTIDSTNSPLNAVLPVPGAPHLTAVAGLSRVALNWSISGINIASGTVIQRSTLANGPFTTVYTFDYNTSTEYVDTSVTNEITYYYRIASKNKTGIGDYSNIVSATPELGSPALPEGWKVADIGNTPVAGSATFSNQNGRSFMMKGSGNAFGGKSDIHSYLYKKVSGNVSLSVRINDVRLSGSDADRVGLVIRDSLNGSSKMASIHLADDAFRHTWFAPRQDEGQNAKWIGGDTHTWLPVWFKLTRFGDTLTGYQSSDGIVWFQVGSAVIPMSDSCYIGMLVCSGSTDTLHVTTAFFDNVVLKEAGSNLVTAPKDFMAMPINSSRLKLKWTAASNALSYQIKRAVSKDSPYAVIAANCTDTSFIDSMLVANKSYLYSIKSVAFSGVSEDSSSLKVTMPDLSVPLVPKAFSATSGNKVVLLNWEYTDEATAYIIQRSDSANGNYTNVATVSDLNYIDSSVSVGGTYYYKLEGINSKGAGNATFPADVTVSEQVKLTGAVIGTYGSYNNNTNTTKEAAMDGNTSTFFDADSSTAWVGLDVGGDKRFILSEIRYVPRSGYPNRMVTGVFQVASDENFDDALTVAVVASTPKVGEYSSQVIPVTRPYRYVRYLSPDGGWGNVAEVEFYGNWVTKKSQTINFNDIPIKVIGDEDFDPQAVASSGLPVSYTSSDSAVGKIVDGKIRITGVGSCTIYANQSGNDFYSAADPVGKTLAVDSIQIGLEKVIVGGISLQGKDSMFVDLGCSASSEVAVEIEPSGNATIDKGNKFQVSVKKPGLYAVSFKERYIKQNIVKPFVLTIEKRFPFQDIIQVRPSNTLILDLNKISMEGYHINSYQWYKNGLPIAGANKNSYTVLSHTSDTYGIEMITSNGQKLHSCESGLSLNNVEAKIYPNPIRRGERCYLTTTIEGTVLTEATIDIFNLGGKRIASKKVTGNITPVDLPSIGGIYLVQLKNSSGLIKEFKIIVTK